MTNKLVMMMGLMERVLKRAEAKDQNLVKKVIKMLLLINDHLFTCIYYYYNIQK